MAQASSTQLYVTVEAATPSHDMMESHWLACR